MKHGGYWRFENVAPWLEKFFTFKRDTHPVWFDYIVSTNKKHGWHLVSKSPWPFWASMSALTLAMGLIFWMHKFRGLFTYNPVTVPSYLLWYGLISVFCVIIFWFRDIIREAVYMGYHTTFVQGNLRLGFMLFIISEVMFFASFFWAFFHSSIDPSIWSGSIWPPEGIVNFFISEDISSLLSLSSFASISETFFTTVSALVFSDFYLPSNTDLVIPLDEYILTDSKKAISFTDFLGITWHLSDSFQDSIIAKNVVEKVNFYNSYNVPFAAIFDYIIEKNNPVNLANSLNNDLNYVSFDNNSIYGDIDFKNIHTTSLNLNLYDSGSLINPYSLPLINTFILLTSGAFLTWSHKSLRIESFREAVWSLNAVIFFAWAFMTVQFHEYLFSALSINDGIFGSTFFMLTGFHGIHVIIGSIFLIVCIFRFLLIHFTRAHHFGYEAAIWYWHFVDVVWVFLYLFVYFWPSNFFFDYSFSWNSIFPTTFDFALPTNFLTYLNDALYEYPFHLIEKYSEVKEDVLRRFSLSTPSIVTMGAVDDFYYFFNMEDDTFAIVDNNDFKGFFDEDFEIVEFRDRLNTGVTGVVPGTIGTTSDFADIEHRLLEGYRFSDFLCDKFSLRKAPEPRPLDIHDPSTWNFSFDHKKGYFGGWKFGKPAQTCEHHRHLEDNFAVGNIQDVNLDVAGIKPGAISNAMMEYRMLDHYIESKINSVDDQISVNTNEENAIFNVEHVDEDISGSIFEPIAYDESNYYNLGGTNSADQNISDLDTVDGFSNNNNKQESYIHDTDAGRNVDSVINKETAADEVYYKDSTEKVALDVDLSNDAAEIKGTDL